MIYMTFKIKIIADNIGTKRIYCHMYNRVVEHCEKTQKL